MAGEFRIKTGLLLGPSPTYPVISIQNASTSITEDASTILVTGQAIYDYVSTLSGASSLSGLSDVSIVDISFGHVLVFDPCLNGDRMWKNVAPIEASLHFVSQTQFDSSIQFLDNWNSILDASIERIDNALTGFVPNASIGEGLYWVDGYLDVSVEGGGAGLSTIEVSSNYTALSNYIILADSSYGLINITLPASPANGDIVAVIDVAKNSSTNNITILRNGHSINKLEENFTIDVNGGGVQLIYHSLNDNFAIENLETLVGYTSGGGTGDVSLAYVNEQLSIRDASIVRIDGSINELFLLADASLDLSEIDQDYLPKVGSTINIGASTNRIDAIYVNDLYIAQNSLWVNDKKVISDESNVITVSTSPNQDLAMLTSGSGNSKVQSDTGILLNITNAYTSKDIELRTDSNSGSVIINANGTNGTVYADAKGNIEINSKSTLKLTGNNITFDSSVPLAFSNLSADDFSVDSLSVTGDTSVYGNLHAGGSLHVGGGLTVDGSLVYTNIESINVSTGFIQLSTGITGTPPSTLQSGIIVNRGTSNPYIFVYDEDMETFRIGISSLETSTHYSDSLTQAVATRQDTPVSNGVGYWNSNSYRIDTSSGFTFTPGVGLGLPVASNMGTENTVLVWNGTTVGSRELGSMAFDTGSYIPNSSIGVSGGVLAYRTFGSAANSNTGDFVAYRTFGTAANNNTGDFVAYRTFGTAANNNTGDFLAYNGKAVDSDLLDGMDSTRFIYGSNGSGSQTAPATFDSGHISQYKSGFWEVNGASWTPGSSWYWGLTAAHTSNSPTYNYSMQLIASNGTSDFYLRTINNGTPLAWRKIYHDGITTFTGNVTGSSASCTGDAGSVDGQNFSYSNDSNSPTYLWGTNSNGTSFLASRGSLSVNYATTAGSATSATSAGSATSATYASYFPTNYAGGVQANPQTYFNEGIGLKIAMTGVPVTWADTLWINGYSGADVPNMCALHTSRQGTPRMWISTQSNRATSYGTAYEFITAYNIASQSVSYAATAGSAPANGGTASACTVTDSDANSTYRMVWHSGTSLYSTAGVYCQPLTEYIYAANFSLTSDASLKDKIVPIPIGSIDVEYKQFVLKKNPDKVRYGVIAQDLQKTNPELVSEGSDGMLSVNYIDLLIKEIASLKARVEELENKHR